MLKTSLFAPALRNTRRYPVLQIISGRYRFKHFALLICLSFIGHTHASESDYLDSIKADYEEFNTGVFKAPPESAWITTPGDNNEITSISLETLDDFSSFLKKESPGSFIFYNVLPQQYQSQLHQDYLKTGNLEEVKKNIFKYSSELKKHNSK
jgi:hypothetical protein